MQEQTFIELIAFIKQNRFLLVKDNIFCLKAFFAGWFFRSNVAVKDETSLDFFQKWIEEKYNEIDTAHSWASIISYHSGDEKIALSDFFELFEKYYYFHFYSIEEIKKEEMIETNSIDDLLELLNLIKNRTPMYIGKSNIFCLIAFINGWYFRDPKNVINWKHIFDFEDWLFKKMKREKHSSSWYNLINYYSSDESEALRNFFVEFEQYLTNQNKE